MAFGRYEVLPRSRFGKVFVDLQNGEDLYLTEVEHRCTAAVYIKRRLPDFFICFSLIICNHLVPQLKDSATTLFRLSGTTTPTKIPPLTVLLNMFVKNFFLLAFVTYLAASSAVPTPLSFNITETLSRRDDLLPKILCKCHDKLNIADTNNAVSKITSGRDIYSGPSPGANWQQSGNVVAFMCAFNTPTVIFSVQYLYDVQTLITSVCGQWTAGVVYYPHDPKYTDPRGLIIGYGFAPFSLDRCWQAGQEANNDQWTSIDSGDRHYKCG